MPRNRRRTMALRIAISLAAALVVSSVLAVAHVHEVPPAGVAATEGAPSPTSGALLCAACALHHAPAALERAPAASAVSCPPELREPPVAPRVPAPPPIPRTDRGPPSVR